MASPGEQLVEAAKAGDVEKMKSALKDGADVNERVKGGAGGTALYQAAFNNQVAAVQLLLGVDNIDVNETNTNESQWSALLAAAIKGHDKVVKVLLDHPDTDVNLENRGGKTALIYAVMGNRIEVAKLLLQHPSLDVNQTDDSGFDALMHAAKENKPVVAELLLQHPNLKLQEKDGRTAVGIAKDRKNKKMEKMLKEYAAVELRTPVGLKLKENGLEQYAKGLYDGKITTIAEARKLNDRDLRYLSVDSVPDRKKILLLFGAVENKKKDETEKIETAIAIVEETRNAVQATVIPTQQQATQSTLSTVTSLPNAPRGQIQQNRNDDAEEIPFAKPVLD